MKRLMEFLQEDNGNNSSMRLLAIFVTLTIIGTWAVISLCKMEVQHLDWTTVAAMVGTIFAKAYQRGNENAVQPSL